MIPALDLAIVSRLKLAHPNVDLRWMPSKLGEKSAFIYPRASDPNRKDKTGQPSSTIFRTAVGNSRFNNVPQKDVGFRGNYAPDLKSIQFRKRIIVDTKYEYVVWAYKQKEVDEICRKTLYNLIYAPIDLTVAGQALSFRINSDDPVYDFKEQDEDGTIRIYKLTFNFTVLDTFWSAEEAVKTVIYPKIHFYEEVTNGTPISLETINLIPEGY